MARAKKVAEWIGGFFILAGVAAFNAVFIWAPAIAWWSWVFRSLARVWLSAVG